MRVEIRDGEAPECRGSVFIGDHLDTDNGVNRRPPLCRFHFFDLTPDRLNAFPSRLSAAFTGTRPPSRRRRRTTRRSRSPQLAAAPKCQCAFRF
ncbi:hypothetical protein GWI33_003850 [Rhynchophorus ferrugineus]|uniref:Uncharacterized protein n=1 Tax=Rhynchophorus ferrugineus TaxID=354439 RepID=A0A834LWW3_RHYFE|nr:hypothetical protein GWI33_003850 [Rhynchophorus ferrugineus]